MDEVGVFHRFDLTGEDDAVLGVDALQRLDQIPSIPTNASAFIFGLQAAPVNHNGHWSQKALYTTPLCCPSIVGVCPVSPHGGAKGYNNSLRNRTTIQSVEHLSPMKLSIIIPVYNEAETVGEIIRQVQKVKGFEKEIIVVDDASTDNTPNVLQHFKPSKNLRVIRHERNLGKGASISTGITKATGDYMLVQDADLEYDPQDILLMLNPVKRGKAQVVYGSRFTGPRRNMFFWHWVGNQLLTLLTNILYNTTLSDMETCYKLMPLALVRSLNLKAKRFEFEPEVTAKILKHGIRIWEVPISYAGREYHEGKKISWKDGLPALWMLVKLRFTD